MCFPALAALPAALGIGSAGTAAASGTAGAASAFQTIGAGLSALGTAASALHQAEGQRAGAALARRQAQLEQSRGDFEVERQRERGARTLAARRAGLLARGLALEGSAADALADTATELSLDEQAIRFGTAVRTGNALHRAKLADANARSATIGGAIGALAPVINRLSERQSTRPRRRTFILSPYEEIFQ